MSTIKKFLIKIYEKKFVDINTRVKSLERHCVQYKLNVRKILAYILLTTMDINPKRCGLFGQLRMRGGVKVSLWQIMVSGHSNFGTDQTNSVSYES